jgi:hypothetical protein
MYDYVSFFEHGQGNVARRVPGLVLAALKISTVIHWALPDNDATARKLVSAGKDTSCP